MPGNCQVQTPNEYVEKMLDYVDYCFDLYGKSVLENSCGDGNILMGIVRRYIDDARAQGIINEQIVKGLENDIVAYEKDQKCIQKCKNSLDILVNEKKLSKVNWNIKKQDYLKSKPNLYDYIIGIIWSSKVSTITLFSLDFHICSLSYLHSNVKVVCVYFNLDIRM